MSGAASKFKHQDQRLRSRITKAHASGKNLHSTTRGYLNSFSARYVAAQEAAQGQRKKLSSERMQLFARGMNLWEPCTEEVRLHPVLKSTYVDTSEGSYRYLLSFGMENQARQILVRNLLQARWETQPTQFQFRGGREKAVRHVQSAYRRGFRYVFELDVYRCFRSFDRKGIAEYLSLPERVVTNVLSGDTLNIALSPQCLKEVKSVCYDLDDLPDSPLKKFALMDDDWGPARSGLTEGSKASPFAAELLLEWVLRNVPDGAWRIVNYADNFLCLCESENAAFELRTILQELLHQHPAGPLKAKQSPKIFMPGDAFEFLGYLLVPKNPIGLWARWSDRAEKKARTLRRLAYKTLTNPSLSISQKKREYLRFERKHRALTDGYPSWGERQAFHIHKMDKIKQAVGLPS